MKNFFHSVFTSSQNVYDAALPDLEQLAGLIDNYDVSEISIKKTLSNLDVRKSKGPNSSNILQKSFYIPIEVDNCYFFKNQTPRKMEDRMCKSPVEERSLSSCNNYRPVMLLKIISKNYY